MKGEDRQLLVFVLSRSGCLAYAHQMIRHLQGAELLVFCSAYALAPPPAPCQKVITYRSSFEFILNTLRVLPAILLQVRHAKKQGFRRAYFPVFHPWNLFLQLWCRALGIRSVVTVHDGILHAGENHPLLQWWESACIRRADELIFLSRYVEANTRRRIGFSGQAHIILHGVLESVGAPPLRQLPARPRILFLGRIVRYKGVERLVEAVEGLPGNSYAHLTIAGMVVNRPAHWGNPEKIRWITHWLSGTEMTELLTGHDILVLPYVEASQSGVLSLGIGAAMPMVITRVGGMTEQLEEEEAVWVAPSAKSIREGIRQLISEPERYEYLHQSLLRRREVSGWQESANSLLAVIFR